MRLQAKRKLRAVILIQSQFRRLLALKIVEQRKIEVCCIVPVTYFRHFRILSLNVSEKTSRRSGKNS